MRKLNWIALAAVIFLSSQPCFAEAPHEIGGFVLGKPIDNYRNVVRMETVLPIRHMEYLSEVSIKPPAGFKSGYVTFGTCEEPQRIVKIRMKYSDRSKDFFDDLFENYEKRFGKPAEYRGDAFQSFIAWKWSFKDDNGDRIGMILQHYSGNDEEYTQGNSVKLTFYSLIQEERSCYEKKHPHGESSGKKHKKHKLEKGIDIDLLLPK